MAKVAFLGLGVMGYPMAGHLKTKGGHEVTVYNRTTAKAQKWVAQFGGRLAATPKQAAELRRSYFREHGTTLNGLMRVHNIDPHEFLAFVHEIDLACVPPNPELVAALGRLHGRKIVHTNGSVRHAERLLDHLGLSPVFSGIIDIVAADFEPKPALAGYRLLLQRHTVRPETALMVEDIARNLAPAAELGMTTAWMRNDLDWAKSDKDSAFIHYIVDDLAGFLAAAAELKSGDPKETR